MPECHSNSVRPRESGDPEQKKSWVPAYAGMSGLKAAKRRTYARTSFQFRSSPRKRGPRAKKNWVPAYAGMSGLKATKRRTYARLPFIVIPGRG